MIRHVVLDELDLSGDLLREPAEVLLATGVIAGRGGVSCAEAFHHLHEYSVGTGRRLTDVAHDVVTDALTLP